MMVTTATHILLSEIIVDDSDRHRKNLTGIEDLIASIERVGLLNPLILDQNNHLIAGRRRYEALKRMGRDRAPYRRLDDLDAGTRRLVELDENLRRVDLPWQETALAIYQLHTLKAADSPSWQQADTVAFTGLSPTLVSNAVAVGSALQRGDSKVAACGTLGSAADLLRRRRALALDEALSENPFDDSETFDEQPFDPSPVPADPSSSGIPEPGEGDIYIFPGKPDDGPGGPSPLPAPAPSPQLSRPPSQYSIIAGNFLEMRGRLKKKFNLIHCDFPYGINFDKSDQGGAAENDAQYKDTPELFWSLVNGLLESQEDLIADSAHMIFWYSMNYHCELIERLEKHGWFVVRTPLIWHKTDGAGIASDYRRRPKHIYETALFCSRGDRPILQLRNDCYGTGLARHTEGHLSAKPQEMLEYFLSMVVTEYSNFLDPTCGSGTSVRAAAALGAKSALGIEINPSVAATAVAKLNFFLERTKSEPQS